MGMNNRDGWPYPYFYFLFFNNTLLIRNYSAKGHGGVSSLK